MDHAINPDGPIDHTTRNVLAHIAASGKSDKEIDDAAGLPRYRVYYWKQGRGQPTIEECRKVAGVLGMTVNELLGPPGSPG